MKYKKILTWACTAALFLTGCTTDTASNGRWMEDSNAVRIQASAGSTLTRSNPIATDEKQTGFNQGDMISVRNRNITVNYTFDGEKLWVPENDKYLVWDEKDLKFEGYYPYDGKNDFSVGYIKKDQSTLKALAQSDYMNTTSNLQSIPSDKHLTLKLERKTARLIFKIQKFNDEFSERAKVTELKIDCPEKTNGKTEDWDPITPYQIGDGGVGTTYTALVIPGVINAVLNTSEKSLDSEGEPQALYLETGTLKAGKSYTYNLIVGKNKVTVGGVTVAEWTPGTPLQGGEAKEEDLTPYVTMTATSNQTFKMTCAGTYTLPNLEYSVNNGTWLKVVADKCVDFGGALGSLRLRGICPNGTATSWQNYSTITFGEESVKVDCKGDIRTLINYTAYKTVATGNCSFISLFQNCTALKSAPQLPAKALKESCYRQMFEGCTSLEQAPDLPATELKESCYLSMFTGCTALTQAPNLPATKLQNYCYQSMFSGCRALTQAPTLSAEDLGWNCYSYMFEGCISLKKAPALPATTLKVRCYLGMFKDCTSLTDAPELKAMKMEASSYKFMFEGCTALVDAPKLPAKELDNYCYESMFKGCTSLTKAPELRATKIKDGCYKSMFEDCKKLISVYMLATEYGYESLSGWLDGAGTEAESRILKVNNWEAYKNIITNLPPIWQRGSKCILWDKDGNKITTTE